MLTVLIYLGRGLDLDKIGRRGISWALGSLLLEGFKLWRLVSLLDCGAHKKNGERALLSGVKKDTIRSSRFQAHSCFVYSYIELHHHMYSFHIPILKLTTIHHQCICARKGSNAEGYRLPSFAWRPSLKDRKLSGISPHLHWICIQKATPSAISSCWRSYSPLSTGVT